MFRGGFGGGDGGTSSGSGSGVESFMCNIVRTEFRDDEYRKLEFSTGRLLNSNSRNLAGSGGGIKSSSLTFESVVSENNETEKPIREKTINKF